MNKYIARVFLLLLLIATSSAQPFVGPWRPEQLPFTPKWGARLMLLLAAGASAGCFLVAPKLKKAQRDHHLIEKLFNELANEKDEQAFAEINAEKRQSSNKVLRWQLSLAGMISGAILFGLAAGGEAYNILYWNPKKWRREFEMLVPIDGLSNEMQEWARTWRKCMRVRNDEVYKNWPTIRRGLTEETFLEDVEVLCEHAGFDFEQFLRWCKQHRGEVEGTQGAIKELVSYASKLFRVQNSHDHRSFDSRVTFSRKHRAAAALTHLIDQLEQPRVQKFFASLDEECAREKEEQKKEEQKTQANRQMVDSATQTTNSDEVPPVRSASSETDPLAHGAEVSLDDPVVIADIARSVTAVTGVQQSPTPDSSPPSAWSGRLKMAKHTVTAAGAAAIIWQLWSAAQFLGFV